MGQRRGPFSNVGSGLASRIESSNAVRAIESRSDRLRRRTGRSKQGGTKQPMRLFLYFARSYPLATAVMLGCLLLAAVAEGVGISTLLPLLGLLISGESANDTEASPLQRVVKTALDFIDRAHAAGKPFFLWWNSTRMHVWTHLKAESVGVTGLGVFPDGMVERENRVIRTWNIACHLGSEESSL